MAIIDLLAKLPRPSGLWPIIISGIDEGVLNFGWTIVIFTIIVKLAMSPLDFLMRWSGKKNALIQKKLAPQVEKINKKYSNNKQMANMQIQSLYKREGLHIFSSCIFSLIYLALTMTVFFTLYSSLRDYSAYNVLNQYDTIKGQYYSVYESTEGTEEQKISAAELAVKETWYKEKDGWLWISNIWRADTQNNPVPSYDSLKSLVSSVKDKKATSKFKEIDEAEYQKIMGNLIEKEKGQWNGYYILAILALGLTFLSQWISELGNKVKSKKKEKTNKFYQPIDDKDKKKDIDPTNSTTMKVLKYVLPVIMVVFVITSSAAFGIYIVTSSLISILINLLINYLVKVTTKKQEQELLLIMEKQERKIKAK